MNELTETQKIIPEHAKKIALAKMDLMKQWFEFRKKSNNKFKADYEFVQLYNTSKRITMIYILKMKHTFPSLLKPRSSFSKLVRDSKPFVSDKKFAASERVVKDFKVNKQFFCIIYLHANNIRNFISYLIIPF